MSREGVCVFDTAVGPCAISWRGERITRVRLSPSDTNPACETSPAWVRAVSLAITRHLAGEVDDLRHVELDLDDVGVFDRCVYEATRAVPPGATRTYGELAAIVGQPRAAQAVGVAMARNPCPIIVPCHRVMGADGRLTGFSAPGGVATKVRLLEIERAAVGTRDGLFGDLPLEAKRSCR